MATATAPATEEALAMAKLAELALPKGVKLRRVVQSEDWTGDPALRVHFSVSRGVPLTKPRLRSLVTLQLAVVEALRSLDLGKWPFVRFDEVP